MAAVRLVVLAGRGARRSVRCAPALVERVRALVDAALNGRYRMAEKVPTRSPPYNHTREDSALTPCPKCHAQQRQIAREVNAAMVWSAYAATRGGRDVIAGRRRCTILEHRRQLKAMQRVIDTLRAQQAEAWARARMYELARDDWRQRYWVAQRARPWWTRWFGIP